MSCRCYHDGDKDSDTALHTYMIIEKTHCVPVYAYKREEGVHSMMEMVRFSTLDDRDNDRSMMTKMFKQKKTLSFSRIIAHMY